MPQCAALSMRGDGWRVRHDEMKLLIRDLHVRAGVPIVCEVFNLFADCIPQPELNRIERGRRRPALGPDFKVRGDGGEGDVLCELKFINACNTWYPRNPRPRNVMRGVKRRADRLTGEYGKKAQQVDQLHCGVPPPPPARALSALPKKSPPLPPLLAFAPAASAPSSGQRTKTAPSWHALIAMSMPTSPD